MMRRLHVRNTYKISHLASCSPKAQLHDQGHARRPQWMRHSPVRGCDMRGQQSFVCSGTPRRRIRKDKVLSGIQVIPNLCTIRCKVVQHQEFMCRLGQAQAYILDSSLINNSSQLHPCEERVHRLPRDGVLYEPECPRVSDCQDRSHRVQCIQRAVVSASQQREDKYRP